MEWTRSICFCALALVSISTQVKAELSGSIRYMEPYAVEGLGVGMPVAPKSKEYKRSNCRPSEQFKNSVWCKFTELKGGVSISRTILHLSDNIVTYINKELSPASFTNSEVINEINRLSREFNRPAHVYHSPKRPGFPEGIIATWGGIQLQPLAPEALVVLAEGRTPHLGVMADFLMNFHELARIGFPVYSLAGSEGYVWMARFDETGKGKLRFFAADPSRMTKIEEQPDYQNEPAQPAPPISNPQPSPPISNPQPSPRISNEERKKAEAEAKKAEEERKKAEAEAKKAEEERKKAEAEAKKAEEERLETESRAKNKSVEQETQRNLQEARDHGFKTWEEYQAWLEQEKRLNESGMTRT